MFNYGRETKFKFECDIILLKDSRDKMEKRETGYLGVQSSVSTIKYLNLTGSRELKSRS